MEFLENVILMFDVVLDTGRKRHIAGGILLSLSLLFGGLSVTVMTIKDKDKECNNE